MVTVRFFGPIAEVVGAKRLELPCQSLGQLIADCASRLAADVASHLDVCAVWVNGRPAESSVALRPGDEVAFLSPVSGG